MKDNMYKFYYFLLALCILQACSFKANFTGGKPDPSLKTISIVPFANDAPLVVSYHSQRFTEQMRDRFLTQSRLAFVNANGDIQLSGAIVDYNIRANTVGGAGGGAQQNRMTISVKIKYENKVNPSESWEQQFSSFIDFPASTNLSSAERELIEQVNGQLTQDIFNKSIGKW